MLPSPSRLQQQSHFSPRPGADLRLVPTGDRVAVLLNANAKKVNEKVLARMARVLPEDDVFYSRSLDDARRHARSIIDRRYATVMVGGGDGTITNAMNLLHEAAEEKARPNRHALPDIGVLKLGTGNGLANLTGAGRPENDVLRMVAGERAPAHPLRLMEDVDSGWKFPFASLGYDARVLNDYMEVVNATSTRPTRWLAKSLPGYFYALYTRTIPRELRQKRAHMKITALGRASMLDPETKEEIPLQTNGVLFDGEARAIAMGTSPFYGYGMRVLPFARRRSDRFHIRVSNCPISYLLTHLPSLWDGTLDHGMTDFLVEGIRIESTERLPLQFAGDARGNTKELEIKLADRTFRFVEGTGTPK